jgi:uncharacterized membrane protein
MSRSNNDESLEEYLEELRRRQKNRIWPDDIHGGARIDHILFKATAHRPVSHRIVGWLFGGASACGGLALMAESQKTFLPVVMSSLGIAAGLYMIWVASRGLFGNRRSRQ